MAKGQAKKVPVKVQAKVQPKIKTETQADNMVFALDIGTRSIIGMVGVVEEDKVKVIAIEKEEHTERAMVDGQIENIEKVSSLARKVKKRLEDKVHTKLKRVSVAAAGRALRTSRVDYEMVLQGPQIIDDEVINRLEAGAISKAEAQFDAENEAQEDTRRFYLVGYTVCQYYLDQYMISSLKDHRGKHIKVDLIATFLPSEVVESLYTTMNKIGLEVASITLEPIAAINAAIPENLRLLNLVIVDIGAGTSDIAACTGGSVTGYTMATIAGDEITESIMKEFLVDFMTAENMKAQIERQEEITFTDILGFERTTTREEIFRCIQGMSESLCKEIAEKILEVNGNAPSALFLAGGGSKLAGLKDGLTAALGMDQNRVAIAGNNFRTNAFSDEYDLNNPEYATPLGIAISSGLNMINDSFRVTLNEKSAKLFRSGSFTVMNLLMMNGYGFQDMLGRSGASVSVRVNGKRKVFYGMAAQPASLFINRKEGRLSDIVHAGDHIEFVPAVQGLSAKPCVRDIEGAAECLELTLNGQPADLETPLKNGDIILMMLSDEQLAARKREAEKKAAEEETAVREKTEEDLPEPVDTSEPEHISEAEDVLAVEPVPEERNGEAGEKVPVKEDMEEGQTEAEIGSAKEGESKLPEEETAEKAESTDVSGSAAKEQPERETSEETVHNPHAGREEEENARPEPEEVQNVRLEPEEVQNVRLEPEEVQKVWPEPESEEVQNARLEPEPEEVQKVQAKQEQELVQNVWSEPESAPSVHTEPEPEELPESQAGPIQEDGQKFRAHAKPEPEELQESQSEPITEELQEFRSRPISGQLQEPQSQPTFRELQEPQSQPTFRELQEPQSQPTFGELQESQSEPITEELQESQSEPITGELQESQSEPITEELQESQAEPISGEVLQASQAEPIREETWNPNPVLKEEKQEPNPLRMPERKPTKEEIRRDAEKLYDADEKSLVQGTLDLEMGPDPAQAADAVPVRKRHMQRGSFPKKEPISKFPPERETPASKGVSGAKDPAALRGRSPAKEGNQPGGVARPSGSGTILFYLNDTPIRLPLKKGGEPYYLMDMIEYSGIDLKQPKGRVTLSVNGEPGTFMQKLSERDIIRIVEEV